MPRIKFMPKYIGTEEEKICTKCLKCLPLDAFYISAVGILGRTPRCKDCTYTPVNADGRRGPKPRRPYKVRKPVTLPILLPTNKTCRKCHVEKNLSEFGAQITGLYGRSARCKVCVSMDRRPRRTRDKAYNRRVREEVFAAYGGKCICCGEDNYYFLSIDHINGGGSKHKASIPGKCIYQWLRRAGFPKDEFRILCFNCNMGRHKNGGICPHKDS